MGCGASAEDSNGQGKGKKKYKSRKGEVTPVSTPRQRAEMSEAVPNGIVYKPHNGYPVHEPYRTAAWAKRFVHGYAADVPECESDTESDKSPDEKNPLRAHDHHFEADDEDVLVCESESCGRETGEPSNFMKAVRIKATVASASWSHDINGDPDQFQPAIDRQWFKHKMKRKTTHRISTWTDAIVAIMIVFDGTQKLGEAQQKDGDASENDSEESAKSQSLSIASPSTVPFTSPGLQDLVFKDTPQISVEQCSREAYCCSSYVVAGVTVRLTTANLLSVKQRIPKPRMEATPKAAHGSRASGSSRGKTR